jgi:hypothetical protein
LSAPTRAARAGNPASPPSRETATSE